MLAIAGGGGGEGIGCCTSCSNCYYTFGGGSGTAGSITSACPTEVAAGKGTTVSGGSGGYDPYSGGTGGAGTYLQGGAGIYSGGGGGGGYYGGGGGAAVGGGGGSSWSSSGIVYRQIENTNAGAGQVVLYLGFTHRR